MTATPPTEETAKRIADALERLVLLVAALMPEEQQPEDPNVIMTQDGPARLGR